MSVSTRCYLEKARSWRRTFLFLTVAFVTPVGDHIPRNFQGITGPDHYRWRAIFQPCERAGAAGDRLLDGRGPASAVEAGQYAERAPRAEISSRRRGGDSRRPGDSRGSRSGRLTCVGGLRYGGHRNSATSGSEGPDRGTARARATPQPSAGWWPQTAPGMEGTSSTWASRCWPWAP